MKMHNEPLAPLEARPISAVPLQPVTWLWQHRLALGKVAMLDGDPDNGKSLVTLDLCARLTAGREFPDGRPSPGPANVIVLNAEDGAGDTLRPRLHALGADVDRVFILDRGCPSGGVVMGLPSDCAALDAALTRTGAKLVVVDPIVAYLDPVVQIGNDASVRRALAPIAELAEKHQCAIVLVRHLNKSSALHSLYRGGGSIGFIAACRSAWLIGVVPRKPDERVLAVVKNNLAPRQPSLRYQVTAREGEPPTIRWLGECAISADQIVAGSGNRPLIRLRHAKNFLALLLKDGAKTVQQIWAAAEEEQVSRTTLKRARKEMKIVSRKLYVDNLQRNYWLLPGQKLPPDIQALWDATDIEPLLAPIREQFPEPTPLDDL